MCRYFLPKMVLSYCVILAAVDGPPRAAQAEGNQVLELRTYTLVDSAAEKKLDAYLEQALLPALLRQGLGPIGVFDQSGESEDGSIKVMVLVPGSDAESVTSATAKLSNDEQYQQTAARYLNNPAKEPIVKRIQSELLLSFDVWPKVVVPQQKNNNAPRLFELRTYESPTEKLGELKVEMFNSGEVPIFLDSGVAPVFMGQALIGDKMPNLTYMTVYDGETEREAAWKKFVNHPDWQTLSKVKKYDGTVSTIHKSDWRPKPYSQL